MAELSPEDDLFARVALFNKFVTQEQVAECAAQQAAETAAGKPLRPISALLILAGHLSPANAGAVQVAIRTRNIPAGAAAPAPTPASAAETVEIPPPAPKPMSRRAPRGDSQIFVRAPSGWGARSYVRPPLGQRARCVLKGDGQRVVLQLDRIAGVELPLAPRLDLAVDPDVALLDDVFRFAARSHKPHELEILAQADGLWFVHRTSFPPYIILAPSSLAKPGNHTELHLPIQSSIVATVEIAGNTVW